MSRNFYFSISPITFGHRAEYPSGRQPRHHQAIRALVSSQTGYRFSNCVIDLQRRELRVDGLAAEIQPIVFDLLCYLVEHRDRVVDKDELLDSIWAGTVVSEASLSQSIRKARAVIGDAGNRQEIIRTVQRRGYRFIAQADDIDVVASPRSSAPEVSELRGTDKYSIAVLPFANFSPDRENDYFADGPSEELLNLLARIP